MWAVQAYHFSTQAKVQQKLLYSDSAHICCKMDRQWIAHQALNPLGSKLK